MKKSSETYATTTVKVLPKEGHQAERPTKNHWLDKEDFKHTSFAARFSCCPVTDKLSVLSESRHARRMRSHYYSTTTSTTK